MRGLLWLMGAGAMVGAGGLLMTQGDAETAAHKQKDALVFPTYQRAADREREAERTTLAPLDATGTATGAAGEKEPAHDPVLVALPPEASTALVFEAGTFLHAPVGQAMLACVGADERAHFDLGIADQGKSWLDLAERVAVGVSPRGELFVVQGKMDGLDVTKLATGATERTYAAGVKMADRPAGFPGGELHGAVWNDSLLLVSHSPGLVEGAIDRLEAGGAGTKLAFDEHDAYGEVYGVIGQDELEHMVPDELRDRVHEVAAHATVHVDAIEEVLLVMDVEGSDVKQVEDLGKALGAAIAVGRLDAKRQGLDDMVRLMDQSRVRPYGDRRLRAEVAIPTALMTKSMRGCRAAAE